MRMGRRAVLVAVIGAVWCGAWVLSVGDYTTARRRSWSFDLRDGHTANAQAQEVQAMTSQAGSITVLAEHVLSTTGSTRGTAYTMSNKIVTLGARTHVAWLDAVSKTMVATFDNEKREWLGQWLVGEGHDNHGGPALTCDSEGYLHIVFGPHGGEFQYFRSARPSDASEWVAVGLFGVNGTYPSLVCDSKDTLHCTYRGMTPPLKLAYQRRPRDGDWSEPVALVDAAVPDGYTQYTNALTLGPDDSLHLAFHVYDLHPAAGKAIGYLRSTDGGDSWMLADGTPVELPFSPDKTGMVEQGPGLDMRACNVALSPEGHPYFIAAHFETTLSTTHIWRWDGTAWRRIDLTPVVQKQLPGCGTGRGTLSFDAEGGLWVSSQAEGQNEQGELVSWIVVLYSGDRGETFETVVASPPSPGGDVRNWYPSLERPTGHHDVGVPHLLYTRGVKGKDNSDPVGTEIRFLELNRPGTD
jgi:hypothetical protein